MLTFADLHYIHHNPKPAALSARVAEVFARHALTLATLPRWSQYAERYSKAAAYLLTRPHR